jgi:Na+/glutamate symporter
MVGADALGNPGTLTEVTEVTGYEELPLTEATTGLLSLKTTGNPVVRHGVNQYEKRREAAAASRESATGTATAARSRTQRGTH